MGLAAHDFARGVQLALLLLASTCWAWHGTRVQLRQNSRWSTLIVSGTLVVLVSASTLLSAYPTIALRELLIFVGLWAWAQTMANAMANTQTRRAVLRTLVLGAMAHSVLVLLLLAVSVLEGNLSEPWAALVGFDNPRFLNHAQTVALPLVAIVSADDSSKRWRQLAWATLVLGGMLLFITYGRATLLALLLGLLAGLWAFGRRGLPYARRTVPPTIVGMLLMWVCYLLWFRPAGYVIDPDQFAHVHYRDYLIGQAVKLWQTSPWLGVGPMHFSHWYNGEAAHPHDLYFQLLAEYGAPATILILLGAGRWFAASLRALRTLPEQHTNVGVGLWGALIGIAVDAAFSGNFVMPVSQLWIAMAIAMVLAMRADKRTNAAPASGIATSSTWSRARGGLPWLVVAAMLWMTVQSYREVLHSSQPTLGTSGAVHAAHGETTNPNPRFWIIGWF